ncbi:MAG: DUF4175 family protein [Gemmatimonadota bacterium]
MSPRPTADAVHALIRPLRGLNAVAWWALGSGSAALILGGLAWSSKVGWFRAPYWVLVAWALAGITGILLFMAARRYSGRLTPRWVAGHLEHHGHWRDGAISSLLDAPATGTSASLFNAADQAQARELVLDGRGALEPVRRNLRARAHQGLVFGGLGLLIFFSAGPVRGSAAALWHPVRAWEATIAPVTVTAAHDEVDRGQSVVLNLKATGRRDAMLWLRGPGEAWHSQPVRLDSAGRGMESIGPLRTDLFARLTSGGRASDTIQVHVRIPAFLGTLTVTAHYPRYLDMEDEAVPLSGDTLLLPTGTTLTTEGAATATLAAGAWVGRSGEAALEVKGAGFHGSFTPRATGSYQLRLTTEAGTPLAGDSVWLPIRIVPDSSPIVTVPVPGADTIAPLSLRLPLVIEVQDDYGVTSVEVESHRISRLGFSDPPRREIVSLPAAKPEHAVLNFDFNLNDRGLLPGDTVRYRVSARDNAPAANVGRSREFVLRLATLSEVRAAAREASDNVSSRLDSLAAESRKLERSTEDLSRERERPSAGQRRGQTEETMSYESAKRAEAVAESQQEMMDRAEALKQSLEELQQSAEAAGLNDPAWQERLKEIQDQLDRALTPELRQKLAELQQALTALDPERAKDALQQLAEAQKELREALERSQELFRRAAMEGDMTNLAAESQELAQQQKDWSEQAEQQPDSARAAAEEKDLARRADSLAAALNRLAPQMDSPEQKEGLQSAAEQASQAAQQMQQAAQSANEGQRQQARKQGEEAARKLDPLGQQLKQQGQAMQQQWRQEVTEAMDRAMTETSRLTQRQLQLAENFRRGDASAATRGEQGALEEGAQKLQDQIQGASGKNALVSPQIAASLARAQQQMQRAREAVATGAPNTREAADAAGEAVDALNTAAYQLSRSRGQVSGSGSGSGLQEAMEQMREMANQQGGVSKDASGMLPMAGNSGMQQQLRQLGARQRAMAEQLERMRANGDPGGAAEMAREARDLARRLESGRLDRETVERQERLFRRMLDAGRTLQGEQQDENKERQSTTPTGDSINLPPALRSRLMGDDNRIRMPDWESLQRLSPEERRLVVEYFQRLSRNGNQ